MGVYSYGLTINHLKRHGRWRVEDNLLKLQGSVFVWKIDQVSRLDLQERQIISGLNSVNLIELAYRLELHHNLAVNDEIGPDVSHVLS